MRLLALAQVVALIVYRFGPPGADAPDPERAMANGRCLLIRRDVLERTGGYVIAARSYCDDVRIVGQLATCACSTSRGIQPDERPGAPGRAHSTCASPAAHTGGTSMRWS